ncbi:hypothetical protein SLA2020_438680 [Shorea laevis]
MASLATLAAVQPATIKGLGGSSITGTSSCQAHSPEPKAQKFQGWCCGGKRGLLLKFLILGGGSTLAYISSTASGDVLPIVKGPQLPPKLGPRGKL